MGLRFRLRFYGDVLRFCLCFPMCTALGCWLLLLLSLLHGCWLLLLFTWFSYMLDAAAGCSWLLTAYGVYKAHKKPS